MSVFFTSTFNKALALAVIALPVISTTVSADDNAPQGESTFARDVAPIFAANCVACHQPGEVAPMSLLTYEDARPWAKSIKKSVMAREMPPWGVNPAHGSFKNDMALDEKDISTLVAWVDQGARRGDPADMPAMPQASDGWKLGEPDYIIELPEKFMGADAEDVFPSFTINLTLPEDKWVQAIEFLPSEKSIVHHIVSSLGLYGMGGDGSGEFSLQSALAQQAQGAAPSEVFAIYVAGIQPRVYAEGTGRAVTKDQLMSFNMHYHANGYDVTDQTRIGLHWGEGELEKKVTTVVAGDAGFHCLPGDDNYEIRGFHVFDQDSRVISFNPHMHVRGKDFRYELVRPNGDREILLDVPKYDYDWQWIYYPTEQIKIEAGSRIVMISHLDNSEANPGNPDPTQDVYHRGPTFQGMSLGLMEFIPEEGVTAKPVPAKEKIEQLLAMHPAEDTYTGSLFGLPLGLHLPRNGEGGMLYAVQESIMVTNTIRNVVWTGDSFTADSTMPMPDAGGTSLLISGTVDADGKLTGKLDMGGKPEKNDLEMYPALVLPFIGTQVAKSREVAAN